MSRDLIVEERARAAFEAVRPTELTHEGLMCSVDALSLALRQACQNLGLTYSECLDRVSLAWGGRAASRLGLLHLDTC